MPLYEYKCREHGIFSELATLADSAHPTDCPQCGATSPRILTLSPRVVLALKEGVSIKAIERNEKAQNEPEVSTVDRRQNDDKHIIGKSIGKSKVIYTADGKKMFPSMRPWMISH
ncbi:MAG: zinc ribbon domain-containing protein [Candidatus Poribacteria bacterium]|jgi:putative FmdB family regulatory protein|nr:zinc ribbon domain-containing protein [Candidatus Poribacteria bacterium]|tara:strand:- start:1525 stop:1869 length:345 start_codon:yes stop_codon:yes gene_type:complete